MDAAFPVPESLLLQEFIRSGISQAHLGEGMAWARALGFKGHFIKKSHLGPQVRIP